MLGYRHYISLCFLENVLQDAQVEIEFCIVNFESMCKGHGFPTLGHNVMVVFHGCTFMSHAADAFV